MNRFPLLLPILVLTVLVSCTAKSKKSGPLENQETLTVDRFFVQEGWGVIEQSKHAFDQGIGATHGGVVVTESGEIFLSCDVGIHVFDSAGNKKKSLKTLPFTHLHALAIAKENGREFLYGAGYKRGEIIKFTTDGEVVMTVPFPKESGVRGNYVPTGIAIAPNGNILVADGYGTNFIFEFDHNGKYLSSWGGSGGDDVTKFTTPHGIAIDTRYQPARILISDREKRRLVHFDLKGKFLAEVITGLRRPCAVSIHGEHVAIAELEGRVALLGKQNTLLVVLGDNPDKSQWANYNVPPAKWKAGVFTAPHGLSWDSDGHLYVQDWSSTGRVSKWQYR